MEKHMKHDQVTATILAGALLSISCGSSPQDSTRSRDTAIPHYDLCVVDSFGVELGDSLRMIGSINDFCVHSDGSVLVLDRAAMRIRVFPVTGEPYVISREGDGPGEMLRPQSICTLQNGTVLIADEMKQAVMAFSPSGIHLGDYFTTDRYVPYRMDAVDSSSIVGSMLDLEMGDEIIVTFFTGRFDGDSIPSVTYSTLQFEWPAPELYTIIEDTEFAAGLSGRVFLTHDNTSYLVSVFDPSGEDISLIENPDAERIPKTPEEMEEETARFESFARRDQAYRGGYEPNPYHQLISLAGVDSEGSLWVERYDLEDGHHFDVWDDSGELAYTASLSGFDGIDLYFGVDHHGILAAVVDSEHYPCVFRLELEKSASDTEY
jgi:hypothetical protein